MFLSIFGFMPPAVLPEGVPDVPAAAPGPDPVVPGLLGAVPWAPPVFPAAPLLAPAAPPPAVPPAEPPAAPPAPWASAKVELSAKTAATAIVGNFLMVFISL